MKKISIILLLISTFILQSCEKWTYWSTKKNIIYGYVTDKETGEPLENIKMTVHFEDYDVMTGLEEATEHFAYTDNEGYYYIKYKREAGNYYCLVPTHNDYIYPILNNWYPPIANGVKENEINFEMAKIGKVKIEGDVRCPGNTPYFLENVKISVLTRPIDNTNYPDTTGIKTFTDADGQFYIEYEGDENYEFFLKPEKEGYYYEWGEEDYIKSYNTDPGYVIGAILEMKKDK